MSDQSTQHDHDHGGGGGGTPLSFDRVLRAGDGGETLVAPNIYWAGLNALNGSGVRGFMAFAHDGTTLTARVVASGLEPDQVHIQHIHGAFDEEGNPKDSFTPGPAGDVDGDGFLELAEGLPSYGPILLNLTSPPGAGLEGF